MGCHMSYSIGPYLPAKVGSEATTCLVAPDSASLIGRAPMLACVPWLRTRWEGSGAPRILWFRILTPCGEGSEPPRVLWFPVGRGPQT
jgi:hypothetical protein